MSDKKRLTAKQVADQLLELAKSSSRQAGSALKVNRVALSTTLQLEAITFSLASGIVAENLIPRWQDEPDGDGWYWVDGYDGPRYVKLNSGTWMNGDDHCMQYGYKLNNRRVCPIGERPEAGE